MSTNNSINQPLILYPQHQAVVNLTSADIRNCSATPVLVLPGTGGFITAISNVVGVLSFSSIVYSGSSNAVLQFGNAAAGAGNHAMVIANGFFAAGQDEVFQSAPITNNGGNIFDKASANGANIYISSVNPFTAGDSNAFLYINYNLIPI